MKSLILVKLIAATGENLYFRVPMETMDKIFGLAAITYDVRDLQPPVITYDGRLFRFDALVCGEIQYQEVGDRLVELSPSWRV